MNTQQEQRVLNDIMKSYERQKSNIVFLYNKSHEDLGMEEEEYINVLKQLQDKGYFIMKINEKNHESISHGITIRINDNNWGNV